MKNEMTSADVEVAVARAIQEGDCGLNCKAPRPPSIWRTSQAEVVTTEPNGLVGLMNRMTGFFKRLKSLFLSCLPALNGNTTAYDANKSAEKTTPRQPVSDDLLPVPQPIPESVSLCKESGSSLAVSASPVTRPRPLFRIHLRSIDGKSSRTIEVTERPTPGVCIKHDADCFRIVNVKKLRRTTTTPRVMPSPSSCCQDASLVLQEVRALQGA